MPEQKQEDRQPQQQKEEEKKTMKVQLDFYTDGTEYHVGADGENIHIEKNETIRLIEARHAKRKYIRDRPVPDQIVRYVLEAAQNAPSTQNTQPWGVCVVQGEKVRQLSTRILERFDAGQQDTKPEYQNRPNPPPASFEPIQAKWGAAFFAAKNLDRNDAAARKLHDRENFTFFDAPLFLVFHLPENAVVGTFLDMGFFLQNVMLGFLSYGIGTCPMYSITRFASVVREELGAPLQGRVIVCGMAVGFIDKSNKINEFIPEREKPETYISWIPNGNSSSSSNNNNNNSEQEQQQQQPEAAATVEAASSAEQ